ncbi:hypothetical protein K438DRAFT_1759379 [Mycena galopus ATCC 62051]|nr:hypothetical protein K438DRAFT_1759379 [Mycena galopus ATCC 62051]
MPAESVRHRGGNILPDKAISHGRGGAGSADLKKKKVCSECGGEGGFSECEFRGEAAESERQLRHGLLIPLSVFIRFGRRVVAEDGELGAEEGVVRFELRDALGGGGRVKGVSLEFYRGGVGFDLHARSAPLLRSVCSVYIPHQSICIRAVRAAALQLGRYVLVWQDLHVPWPAHAAFVRREICVPDVDVEAGCVMHMLDTVFRGVAFGNLLAALGLGCPLVTYCGFERDERLNLAGRDHEMEASRTWLDPWSEYYLLTSNKDVLIPRVTLRLEILHHELPAEFDNRFVGKKKQARHRTPLKALGRPYHQEHFDGHKKLSEQGLNIGAGIHLPTYGRVGRSIFRHYTLTDMGSAVNEMHKTQETLLGGRGHLHSLLQYSSPTKLVEMRLLRNLFRHSGLTVSKHPAHITSTPIEGFWGWLRNGDGHSVQMTIQQGAATGIFLLHDSIIHRLSKTSNMWRALCVGRLVQYNSGHAKGLNPEFEFLGGADHRHYNGGVLPSFLN